MTEIEKIEYAKSFIDKLASGINPLTDSPIPEQDIANNVRLSRCFFFVSDILRQVIESGGVQPPPPSARPRRKAFSLTDEECAQIQISPTPIPISEIAARLNAMVDSQTTKRISAASINNCLVGLGMLEEVTLPDGKHRKMPTAEGEKIGIFSEERVGQFGTYMTVLFSSSAQQFIYDNLEAIVAAKPEKKEGGGRTWTKPDDIRLVELFKKGSSVGEIAHALQRSEGGIRARLVRLGLIENRSDIH